MFFSREQIADYLRKYPSEKGIKNLEAFLRHLHPYLESADVKAIYDKEYRKKLANLPIAFVISSKYPIHIYGENTFLYLKRKLNKNDNVLEIGCDSGNFLLGLLDTTRGKGEFVGIDFNENAINEAESKIVYSRNKNCKFFCCDVNDFKTKLKFDYIILNDVIEHLSDRELTILLHTCQRMLNDNGEIVMHTPNGLNEYCMSDSTILSSLYFYLYHKITGESVKKSIDQLYHEQVHINVKSYRKWKIFFEQNGYCLDVKYDKEKVTSIMSWIHLKHILHLNCNMLLIARRR